jgi:hypothetical protein
MILDLTSVDFLSVDYKNVIIETFYEQILGDQGRVCPFFLPCQALKPLASAPSYFQASKHQASSMYPGKQVSTWPHIKQASG